VTAPYTDENEEISPPNKTIRTLTVNRGSTPVGYFDKRLGKRAHRRHRDVIFGKKAIGIIANKLPDSCRLYLTRHNDELKKNAQAIRLAQAS
jgi:hypothetical protein